MAAGNTRPAWSSSSNRSKGAGSHTAANSYKYSTCDLAAPSMPWIFGLPDSIAEYSLGACAPFPWPRPKWPAGSRSGSPVNNKPRPRTGQARPQDRVDAVAAINHIVYPMLDAHLLLGHLFALAFGGLAD